jgi:hypothetical protein
LHRFNDLSIKELYEIAETFAFLAGDLYLLFWGNRNSGQEQMIWKAYRIRKGKAENAI